MVKLYHPNDSQATQAQVEHTGSFQPGHLARLRPQHCSTLSSESCARPCLRRGSHVDHPQQRATAPAEDGLDSTLSLFLPGGPQKSLRVLSFQKNPGPAIWGGLHLAKPSSLISERSHAAKATVDMGQWVGAGSQFPLSHPGG